MSKSSNGIYIVGDNIKFNNSKYPNDKYDRELYIPKGYILQTGEMLTREYGRMHEDMAKRFIEENYYTSYLNDFVKDHKDYMLMRLHALQVLSCGQKKILYCNDHLNSVINNAIASYLNYGWSELIGTNPFNSYYDFIRYDFLLKNGSGCLLVFGGEEDEKEVVKQNILKRCK